MAVALFRWRMFLSANRYPPSGQARGQASPEHALCPRLLDLGVVLEGGLAVGHLEHADALEADAIREKRHVAAVHTRHGRALAQRCREPLAGEVVATIRLRPLDRLDDDVDG